MCIYIDGVDELENKLGNKKLQLNDLTINRYIYLYIIYIIYYYKRLCIMKYRKGDYILSAEGDLCITENNNNSGIIHTNIYILYIICVYVCVCICTNI